MVEFEEIEIKRTPGRMRPGVFIVTALFGFVVVVLIMLSIIGVYFKDLLTAVGLINSLEPVQMLGWGFVSVMSLYFSGGVINSFFKGDKK